MARRPANRPRATVKKFTRPMPRRARPSRDRASRDAARSTPRATALRDATARRRVMSADAAAEAASIERALQMLALTADDALERVLARALPAAISALATKHAANVALLMQLFKHVNARVNAMREVKLPTTALLELYARAEAPMVRNFALVYAEKALEREDGVAREEATSRALCGLASASVDQGDILCRLAFECLGEARVGDARRSVAWLDDAGNRRAFLRRARDFFAYSPNATGTSAATTPNRLEAHLSALASAAIGVEGAPEGALRAAAAEARRDEAPVAPALSAPPSMSPSAVERVLGKGKPKPEPAALAKRKLKLLDYIASASVSESVASETAEAEDGSQQGPPETRERFLVSGREMLSICLIASCDSDHDVSKRGEELLKRRCSWETNRPVVNLDDASVADELFQLFLGSSMDVPEMSRILPASPSVKLKIMNLLTRSMAAADAFPKNIETVKMCLYGVGSTTRLKACGMQFTVWILAHATNTELMSFAPSLMAGMLEILDARADGANEDQSAMFAHESLRGFCYQALSQLAARDKSSVNRDVLLAERIFEALEKEPDSVKSYVQEAARTLVAAYRESPSTYVQTRMEELILSAIEDKDNKTRRLVGAQWAYEFFPFSHAPSRYASVIATGDAKHEMQTLGHKGLVEPSSARQASENAMLQIKNWEGCDRSVSERSWSSEDDMFDELMSNHYSYMEYVAYCRGNVPRILEQHPSTSSMMRYIATKIPGITTESSLMSALILPENAMSEALHFLNECMKNDASHARELEPEVVKLYLSFLNRCMIKAAGPALVSTALLSFIDLIERRPHLLEEKAVADAILVRLRHFVSHTDVETRRRASKLCGVLVRYMDEDMRIQLLDEFLVLSKTDERGARLELQEGAICAAGYIVGSGLISQAGVVRAIQTFSGLARKVGKGQSVDATLASIAAEAIGHAAIRNTLPEDVRMDALEAVCEVMNNTDASVVKLAARAAGHIMIVDVRESTASILLPKILALADVKNDDAQFVIGEALAFSFGGVNVDADRVLTTSFTSLSAAIKLESIDKTDVTMNRGDVHSQIEAYDAESDPRVHIHRPVLDAIFNQFIYSTRVERRCAACVWLLSLIVHTNNHPRLLTMLEDVQEAFGSLLGDQNDLTQELASRGMSMLYDMSDEAQREALLASLMGTLNGAAPKKRHVKLDDKAQVFNEGTISLDDKALRSGDGDKSSLTTYQELCSVVTDIGQPDLIYKFMDLANHQRALNSSRGAAFGFASIAKRAGDAVTPHLTKLIPKLFRMMHDPNPQMQDAVKGIWISLVDSTKKALDQHFEAIMEEVLRESGSRLWRNRQSSANALGELLSGRTYKEIQPHLEQIWTVCLRLIDDIKETVRLSGEVLCKSVRSLTLRLCDAHHSGPSEVKGTIEIVLPILLERGLLSTVKEVQALSMDVIMKLAKFADGGAIKPHIPEIVKTLLESLSSMEDARLNYIEQHAASFGQEASNKLEAIRLRAAKSSPMGETLDLLMAHIDEDVMSELVSTLQSVLRSGIGLNTRAGAGRFVQRMCMRRGRLVRPHAASLFAVLLSSAVNDASASVRLSFIGAIAAIAKYAEEPQVHALVNEIARLFEAETEGERAISAQLALELSRTAPDALNPQKTLVLPISFVGSFDSEEAGKSEWTEVWSENSGGVSASLRVYLPEILSLTMSYLKSAKFQRKRQAAEVLIDICQKSPDVISGKASEVMIGLMTELPGRLWDGKTRVLDAVAALTSACPLEVDVNAVMDALVTESLRAKTDYRRAALKALDSSLVSITSIDSVLDETSVVSKIIPVVETALLAKVAPLDDIDSGVGAAGSLEKMKEAQYEGAQRQKAASASATSAMTVLATLLNRTKSTEAILPHAVKCFEMCVSSLDAELSKERRREALKSVVGLMRIASKDSALPFDVEPLLALVVAATEDASSTAVRLDAIEALSAIARHAPMKSSVESALKKVLSTDKAPEVVRSAMRAKAEISGDSVPMTA